MIWRQPICTRTDTLVPYTTLFRSPENITNPDSDTQTQPSKAMRLAMAEAPVGDEQRGDDPSVNRLCKMTAELLDKEAAVFLPSGTMCNQLAIDRKSTRLNSSH